MLRGGDKAAAYGDQVTQPEEQSPPDVLDSALADTGEIPIVTAALADPVADPDSAHVSESDDVDPSAQPATDPFDQAGGEWFTGELDVSQIRRPRRNHFVTAVMVAHDGASWLPAALTTLAQQTRLPDVAVGVDAASTDDSAGLLLESFGPERTLRLDENPGFGTAVREGLAHLAAAGLAPARTEHVEWVWLLHDDAAPDPDCLQALIDTADDHPDAAILGPKILGWHDRRLLLEVGVTVSGAGRRVTGLESREHDQGQHDGVHDVLAVSSAGMLVRRAVWDALGGFDPELPLFRDDLDLCWRAQRMGERVLIATDAQMHHREASAHGRRAHRKRPHRADREAVVHVLLAQATTWALPLVAIRLFLGSLVRAVVYLLGKDVQAARDEVAAVISVATHPSALLASHRRVLATSTSPASVVQPLKVSLGAQFRHAVEVVGGVLTTSSSDAQGPTVSALESGPLADESEYLSDGTSTFLRRTLLRPSVLFTVGLALVAIIGTRGLWLGDGVLQGGALLPAPEGAADLWETYSQAWHDVGPGSTVPSSPYLMVVLAAAMVLFGKAPVAVTVLLLLGIPLAALSAYFSLRGLIPSNPIRMWAGATYALLPAMTGAVASGRIGLTIAAIALPIALRSLVRTAGRNGTARRSAGTALIVAVVLCTTPAVWLIMVAGGIAASVYLYVRRDPAARPIVGRLALSLLSPLVLLLPWSWYAITHPVILMLEPGINSPSLTDPGLTPWDVLLLHPGGPGMTPVWLSVCLIVAGLFALMRADRIRIIAAFGVLAGLGLAMGLIQSMVLVTPPGAAGLTRPWPGPATLVIGLSLIAAAAVAAEGLRGRLVGSSFTLGQPLTAFVALAALVVPLVSAGALVIGVDIALRRAPASSFPAFVAADSESPQAPRTLILEQVPDGPVRYSLVNGSGQTLGDAETEPPASVWTALDGIVAAMASGRGGDEIRALDGYGVRYVLLSNTGIRTLVPTLDAEPGLRRLSTSGGEVLWRVSGVTSRARVVSADAQAPLGLAPQGTVTADPYLDQSMPEGGPGRALAVGATLDGGWRAASQGRELTAASAAGNLAWSQAFALPDGSSPVRVWFDDTARARWLWWQGIVLAVLIVLALPSRRRVDPDPDFDDEYLGSDIATEPHHGGELA